MKKLIFAIVLLTIPFYSNAVVINGKDWRQLTETTGFSFNNVSNSTTGTCDVNTGLCNGSLGGVDFTGWTWATNEEVGGLFNYIVGTTAVDFTISGGDSYREYASEWADRAVDSDGIGGLDTGLFLPTIVDNGEVGRVLGITRSESTYDQNNAFMPGIYDAYRDGWEDQIATTTHGWKSISSDNKGLWMYREVPVSAPLALMLIGLAGIGFSRRLQK